MHGSSEADRAANQRRAARKSCYLKIDGLGDQFSEVLNISPDGMLVAYDRALEAGKPLHVRLYLPTHPKPLRIQSTVLRSDEGGAALGFSKVGAKDRALIKNFIANETSYDTLKKFQKRVSALQYENLKPFTDPERVRGVLKAAERSKGVVAFTAITLDGKEYAGCYLDAVDEPGEALAFSTMADLPALNPFDAIFFVFKVNGVPYYLEAVVRQADDFTIRTTIPEFMYYAEKRIQNRRMNEISTDLVLTAPAGGAGPGSGPLSLPVLEIDSFGMSVQATMEQNVLLPESVVKGLRLTGEGASRRSIPTAARVAHVTPMSGPAGNFVRVGLQYLLERRPYVEGKARFPKQAAGVRGALEKVGVLLDSYVRKGLERVRGAEEEAPFEVIRTYNRRQEEIVGLVNATFPLDRPPEEPVPTILIAPAHGKRKETTSAFALTLLQNFKKHGKPVSIVRYDQI
ncbi:MAG: PilZ domain-containing protein, partial [Candidatus Methylomirabilis sp.]|nr:PilZ domain-containing protein [Deltaproteobacteria bacterium]